MQSTQECQTCHTALPLSYDACPVCRHDPTKVKTDPPPPIHPKVRKRSNRMVGLQLMGSGLGLLIMGVILSAIFSIFTALTDNSVVLFYGLGATGIATSFGG